MMPYLNIDDLYGSSTPGSTAAHADPPSSPELRHAGPAGVPSGTGQSPTAWLLELEEELGTVRILIAEGEEE